MVCPSRCKPECKSPDIIIEMDSGREQGFKAGTILGPYRLIAKLGSGGMAEVFLGERQGAHLSRPVAIKRMRPELTTNPEFVGLFLEEAKTAALLSHPNICAIHDLEEVDDFYVMTMEYLEGIPLSTAMIRAFQEPDLLPLGFIAGVLAQACEGIHHAHDLCDGDGTPYGIIHRDVSPPNLFITTEGVVKILDFGISKSRNSLVRTMTGQIRGKFSYMSPEQLRGEVLDRRSDVFALGIVFFEMLAARRLFRRRNRLNIFHAIVRDPIPSVQEFCPTLPDSVAAVVKQSLSRDRGSRYESARAMGDAITKACKVEGGFFTPREISETLHQYFGTEIDEAREMIAQGSDHGGSKGGHRVPQTLKGPGPTSEELDPKWLDTEGATLVDIEEVEIVEKKNRPPKS